MHAVEQEGGGGGGGGDGRGGGREGRGPDPVVIFCVMVRQRVVYLKI